MQENQKLLCCILIAVCTSFCVWPIQIGGGHIAPPNCLSSQLPNPSRKLISIAPPGFKNWNKHFVFTQSFPFAG